MSEVFSSTLAWRRRLGFGDFVRWTRRQTELFNFEAKDQSFSTHAKGGRDSNWKLFAALRYFIVAIMIFY